MCLVLSSLERVTEFVSVTLRMRNQALKDEFCSTKKKEVSLLLIAFTLVDASLLKRSAP